MVLRAARALPLAFLALGVALPSPEVSAEEAALLSLDDECGAAGGDGASTCALHALQYRRARLHAQPAGGASGATTVAAEGSVGGSGAGEQHAQNKARKPGGSGKHAWNILDRGDYSKDAAAFLAEALRTEEQVRLRQRGNGSSVELKTEDDASPMCDLTPMSYAQVIAKWTDFQSEWMSKLPVDVPPGTRREFNEHIRQAFPEVLYQGNPVVVKDAVKELGWSTGPWEQGAMEAKLGDLQFREMGFGYPAWVGDSENIGLGTDAGGEPRTTSFGDYLERNRSAEDIFLFLNEEMPINEPRLPADDENKAAFRLRNDFSPTPPFAYPAKMRMALVAIDGRGSSHGLHEHSAVWQVQLHGYKMWNFMPPSTPFSLGVHKRGGTPLVKGKPFVHPNGCAMLKQVPMPPSATKCLVAPGDMLILPANWVHSTCGLSEYTASAGGWLHSREMYRDGGPPGRELSRVLEMIMQNRAENSWSEDADIGMHSLTDEEDERRAGLSPEMAQLDRKLHPVDFDRRIGRIAVHDGWTTAQ